MSSTTRNTCPLHGLWALTLLLGLAVAGEAVAASSRLLTVAPGYAYVAYNSLTTVYLNAQVAATEYNTLATQYAGESGLSVTFGAMTVCPNDVVVNGEAEQAYANNVPYLYCEVATYCLIAGASAGTCNSANIIVAEMALYCPSGEGWELSGSEYLQDPDGGSTWSTAVCQKPIPDAQSCNCDSPPDSALGSGAPTEGFGDPIFGEDGTNRQTQTDYADPSGGLTFSRTYRSDGGAYVGSYQSSILPPVPTGGVASPPPAADALSVCDPAPLVQLNQAGNPLTAPPTCFPYIGVANQLQTADPSGLVQTYNWNGTSATPADPSTVDTISQVAVGSGQGWLRSKVRAGSLETYDANGVLQQRTSVRGETESFTYSTASTAPSVAPGPGYLLSVADEFGRQISFTYDASGRLASMADPAGLTTTYGYASQDQGASMTSVTYPDGTSRQYSWNESNELTNPVAGTPPLLTGIYDETGQRYATFSYNGLYASSTQEAGGVNNYTLSGFIQNQEVTVTDPLGTVRNYSYAVSAGITETTAITQPSACAGCGPASVGNAYDSNGNLLQHSDFKGNVTCYAYTTPRNLEVMRLEGVAPRGSCPTGLAPAAGTTQRLISTAWHPIWSIKTSQAEPNRITTWVYNGQTDPINGGVANCAPSSATLPDGEPLVVLCKKIEQATTDTNGSSGFTATLASGVPNRTWQWTYDAYGRVLTATGPRTDLNSTTTYSYYTCITGGQCGQVQTMMDPVGNVTTYNSYNAYGQPLSFADPNGVVTTLAYDARHRLISRSTAGEKTTFSYYPTGLLQAVALPDSSTLQYTYDGAHRLIAVQDSFGNSTAYTLDAMGNRVAVSTYDPNQVLGTTQSRVYNALSELYQVVGSAGTMAVTTTYAYDNSGNQTNVNAPLGRNTSNTYDALDRLVQVTDPNSGNTLLTYDGNDNLVAVQDPVGLITTYQYNGLGDLLGRGSPQTGATINTYDSGGNLAASTDARGVTATYSYDALNRMTQGSYGDQTINYGYDAGSYGKGHLTSASDATQSLTWQYDALGRVIQKTEMVGGVTAAVGYTYANGDMVGLTTPSGQSVSYAYSNHQITTISVNGTQLLSNVVYEPFGPAQGWTWGNGAVEIRAYDTDGNPSQFTGAESTTYTVDSAFRITSIANASNPSVSLSYDYDLLDRLSAATGSSTALTWTYDGDGNRLTQGGSTSTDGTGILTYNNRGRLAGISTASGAMTAVYNALGQRIQKASWLGTTEFMYDERGHVLGEYDGNGNLLEETVWMGDLPVATLQPNGAGGINVLYIHADHLSTPKAITRSIDNAIVWRWDQDPFGTAQPNSNPSGLGSFPYNLRFPGQYYDSESGLSQNVNRDYDPVVGRYLESDPIGIDGGVNTYGYAMQDPSMMRDPLGLDAFGDCVLEQSQRKAGGDFRSCLNVLSQMFMQSACTTLNCTAKCAFAEFIGSDVAEVTEKAYEEMLERALEHATKTAESQLIRRAVPGLNIAMAIVDAGRTFQCTGQCVLVSELP